jgi:tRNA-splicing ligase RtcB
VRVTFEIATHTPGLRRAARQESRIIRGLLHMQKEVFTGPLEQVGTCCYRIPKSYKPGMRVDGLIFTSEELLKQLKKDQAPEQVANVAFLPGIQYASLAMPDIHWGYGFPIGGVCATDPDEGGVISPGGVGYDINCGVRLMRTNLTYREVKPQLRTLVESLFRSIPSGVGRSGRFSFKGADIDHLLHQGAGFLVGRGLASSGDIDFTEAHGRLDGADPSQVSELAKQRGASQCGTLGSGNHFLEIQIVDAIFDEDAAAVRGL